MLLNLSSIFFFFEAIDLFKSPMYITLNNKRNISTKMGKLLSFAILGYFFYAFASSNMLKHTEAQVLIQDISLQRRPPIFLTPDNYTIVFSISDWNNTNQIEPTIFSYTVYIQHQNPLNQTSIIQKIIPEVCTPDYFKDPSIYYKLNMKNMMCLPKNTTFLLNGYWDEEDMDFLWLSLDKCVNSTENGNMCADKDAIHNYFSSQTMFFNMYMTDYSIDANDYLNPITAKIKNIHHIIDINLKKLMEFSLKYTEITTDDGIYTSNQNIKSTFQHDGETIDLALSNDQISTLAIFNLYTSGKKNQIIRKYQRLDELFASIGGFINLFIIFGFILSRLETQFRIKYIMMNELYNLEKDESKGAKSNLESFKTRWSSFGLSPKKINAKANDFAFGKTVAIEAKERKYWKFNFFEYLKFLFKYHFCTLTHKERKFNKGSTLVDEHLDIVKILKKLQEIDKLKSIFMDPRQKELFKYMEKPSIKETTIFQKTDLKKIYEETKQKAKNSLTDKRLIQLVNLPNFDMQEKFISSTISIPAEDKPNKIK